METRRLTTARDVLAMIRDVLLIIVLTALIAVSVMAKGYFDELESRWQEPAATLPVDECGGSIC